MSERAPGWRQGPDGRWYPPVNERKGSARVDPEGLAEVATLVNSGELTSEIDDLVGDPELTP